MSQISDKLPGSVEVVRLPVDKPEPAVQFLYQRGGGVMDLIAHFWERLPQTPPRLRDDLHLVLAVARDESVLSTYNDGTNILDEAEAPRFCGAMLYVPKAHRADVLALTPPCSAAFARYIAHAGMPLRSGAAEAPVEVGLAVEPGTAIDTSIKPLIESSPATNGAASKVAIDFLTGGAEGLMGMVPYLLPLVHKRVPARQLVNVFMQHPPEAPAQLCSKVRLAKDSDVAALSRWRKLYKEERGILFDADIDAWIASEKVFVLEHEGQVVAAAKFDLELTRLVEIGGVFTFPEFRKQGFGRDLMLDLVARIHAMGKNPTLQVDRENTPATAMYTRLGWKSMGELARVWLTG